MITTRKKQIPLHWILLAAAPWGAGGFIGYTTGAAFLFSLRAFIDNPVGLTFILTLPSYISLFLAPICSFLSDRIWTRFGRRKPFVLISWIGMMAGLVLMPLMPNFWSLIAIYMLFSMSVDIGGPLEPLAKEIVPPHQRGGATGAMQWMANGANLVFYFVALGRFNDVRFMGGWLMSGEKLIYWSAGLLLLVTFFLIALGIKEINPKSLLVGQRLSVRTFFSALFDHDLWPVYTLAFGAAMLASGLGPLGNLLYTDQWSYTKQDMGTNVAVGGVLNIFIIGFLALVADRFNRLRAYQALITLSLFVQVFYFVYVECILPDRRPSLVELILFGESLSIIATLTGMIYLPLVYDYIIRDKMGTYGAGAAILRKVTGILTLNAVGFFVWGYAMLYGLPAGEMVRVCFKDEVSTAQVRAMVAAQSWTYPISGGEAPASAVQGNAWYPTGTVRDTGIRYQPAPALVPSSNPSKCHRFFRSRSWPLMRHPPPVSRMAPSRRLSLRAP